MQFLKITPKFGSGFEQERNNPAFSEFKYLNLKEVSVIQFEFDEKEGVAVVYPEQKHGLSEDDFRQLTSEIDRYLSDHNELRGLVIVTKSFPGWNSLKAFTSHLKFVHDHHQKIRKVALASDSSLLSAAPHLARHFVKARIRHFDSSDIDQAKSWAASEEDSLGQFTPLEGLPEDVVAFRAEGTIDRKDYEETLIPTVERKLDTHEKIKLLIWFGDKFEGYSAGAIWDDAWFGTKHLADFSKIAVVSDVNWLRHSVKFFAPLIPAQIQLFLNADLDAAKIWISED